jgi:NADH:ubiquinone oxidoreductase subunit 4 (subunit M)
LIVNMIKILTFLVDPKNALLSLLIVQTLLISVSTILPEERDRAGHYSVKRSYALLISLVPFLWSLAIWANYDSSGSEVQMIVSVDRFRVSFGIDGVGLSLLILSTGLFPLIFMHLRSDRGIHVFLLLNVLVCGAITILDLISFYILFETCLMLLYVVVARTPYGNIRAAYLISVYTMTGSMIILPLMFLELGRGGSTCVVDLINEVPVMDIESFLEAKARKWAEKTLNPSVVDSVQCDSLDTVAPKRIVLSDVCREGLIGTATDHYSYESIIRRLPRHLRALFRYPRGLFMGFGLMSLFGIKLPLVPFHLWLPEAHVAAPTSGSVLLAGVLLKLGGIGIIRYVIPLAPLFICLASPFSSQICLITYFYSAVIVGRQVDLKRQLAYSSVTHMALIAHVLLCMGEHYIYSGGYMMVAHGIVSPGLFILIGVLSNRYNSKLIAHFKGLGSSMPLFSILFFLFSLSNLSFPLSVSFIGEYLCLSSLYSIHPLFPYFYTLGQVVTTLPTFWTMGRILTGQPRSPLGWHACLSRPEFVTLITLMLANGFLGT